MGSGVSDAVDPCGPNRPASVNRMWIYYQNNGLLINGTTTLHCYAGIDEGKNNPAMEHVRSVGPLPRGLYTASQPQNSEKHGPYAMWLIPDPENEMRGRDAFMYHADSIKNPGRASNGCIVSIGTPITSGRAERELFWISGDHRIEVRSGVED